MEHITKVHPINFYLRQLDSSDYNNRAQMMKAARDRRNADKKEHDQQVAFNNKIKKHDRDFDKWMRSRQFHSMAQRRYAVRHGTHQWCSAWGFFGCKNTGYYEGRNGLKMKCGRCRGEGVIRNRKKRK